MARFFEILNDKKIFGVFSTFSKSLLSSFFKGNSDVFKKASNNVWNTKLESPDSQKENLSDENDHK